MEIQAPAPFLFLLSFSRKFVFIRPLVNFPPSKQYASNIY